jgi:hypothetical protein
LGWPYDAHFFLQQRKEATGGLFHWRPRPQLHQPPLPKLKWMTNSSPCSCFAFALCDSNAFVNATFKVEALLH